MSLLLALMALVLPGSADAASVYVSNQTSASIEPFHIAADGSLTPIACSGSNCETGNSPTAVAITPNGKFLYTANYASGTITINAIAPDGSLSAVTGCGSNCIAGTSPYGLAISPNGKFLFAANWGSSNVSAFSINADGLLTKITCTPASNCATGTNPVGIAVSPDGTHLYVGNLSNPSPAIHIFSIGSDGSLTPQACTLGECDTPNGAEDLTLSPDGHYLYAAYLGSGPTGGGAQVFKVHVDGSLSQVTCAACANLGNPIGIAASPNGKYVYPASRNKPGPDPFSINSDGSLTAIACSGTNCTSGTNPISIAVDPSTRFLYTTSYSDNKISPFAIAADGSLTPIACSATNCASNGVSENQSIVVSPDQAPIAAFSATPAPPGSTTRFNSAGSSASPGYSLARYDWNFGDGSTAANGGPSPSHTYASPGTYTVTLALTDSAGCSTGQVFTGQTVSCNGGPGAVTSRQVTISNVLVPPNTKITSMKISRKKKLVRFTFKGIGTVSGFQCTFVKKSAKKVKTKFVSCHSPKVYKGLKKGSYTFQVRARNAAGPDPTPAHKSFKF